MQRLFVLWIFIFAIQFAWLMQSLCTTRYLCILWFLVCDASWYETVPAVVVLIKSETKTKQTESKYKIFFTENQTIIKDQNQTIHLKPKTTRTSNEAKNYVPINHAMKGCHEKWCERMSNSERIFSVRYAAWCSWRMTDSLCLCSYDDTITHRYFSYNMCVV